MTLLSKLILLGLLLLGLVVGAKSTYGVIHRAGYTLAAGVYEQALADQKKEARALLKVEIAKVAEFEEALRGFKTNQDIQDVKNQTTVAGLQRRLASLAGPAGRLRDPNAAGCRGSGVSASGEVSPGDADREGHGADAGGLFSAEATGLLFELTQKADAINNAYISCRADAINLRGP